MPDRRRLLHLITRVLLVLAIILLLTTLLLWFLAETGRVTLRGLEPINVFVGFVVSALLWLLGRFAEQRLDSPPPAHAPQTARSTISTTVGDSNITTTGDRNVNAVGGSVAAGGNIGNVNLHVDQGEQARHAEQTYLKRLAAYCDALPLGALGGEDSATREATLSDVFIALDTTQRQEHEAETGLLRRLAQRDAPRAKEPPPLSALQAATDTPRMVLLGDPGGGKSSFVKHLAGQLALALLGQTSSPPGWRTLLPLFTVLRDLAPRLEAAPLAGKSSRRRKAELVKAVRAQWRADIANHGGKGLPLDRYLADGRVLLVFDGLDELPHTTRRLVRDAVDALFEAYPVDHVIVTCRVRSYEGATRLPDFTDFTLAPLDREKIERFVERWYETQDALNRLGPQPTLTERIADLQDAARREDLRSMAQNPMLLTTMTLVHQQETELPAQRVVLYRLAVNILLRRWQTHKGYQPEPALDAILRDEYRIRPVLETIAWHAHTAQSDPDHPTDLSRGSLYELLDQPETLGSGALADSFLDYIDVRAGLLIGHGGDDEAGRKPAVYTFPHRTFQEYLAGCYLIQGRETTIVRNIRRHAAEGDVWALAVQYGAEELLYNKRRPQQFLDLAYGLCPHDAPRSAAEWRSALWSGALAVQIGRDAIERDAAAAECTDRGYLGRLVPRLIDALTCSQLTPVERAEAGRHLAHLGDPRPGVLDVDQLPLCYVPPGPFTMGSDRFDEDEKPQHTVDLDYGYWLAQLPVTNAHFETFVADGGYAEARFWLEAAAAEVWQGGFITARFEPQPRARPYDHGEPFTLANHPVVGVTWYEMLAFTRWLTERWRANGVLPAGWGVCLPSEAEWEKGARGGHRVPQAPWVCSPAALAAGPPATPQLVRNDNLTRSRTWAATPQADAIDPALCNYGGSQIGASNAVGVFPQVGNPYGCWELLGNVYEWSRSHNRPYGDAGYSAADGREDLAAGIDVPRVLRGGAFYTDESWARCGFRAWNASYYRYRPSGFRVAVSPLISAL